MQKYQKLKKLGSGSFGNVQLAENTQTKQIVAIKQLKKKYGTWDQCLQMSEVKALRKMAHPNIIKLKQMIRVGNDANLVFEYIERDLYKLITQRRQKGKVLQDNQIRHISKQMVQALSYIHKQGFFHRDLKPQNVLIDSQFNIKLIDFGIAKQIRSKPPFTQYCSTRWYRAPQILFKFSAYSAPVDIFALGCIVAEMYLMKPLFLGNSQMDQISKITSVLGTPKNWVEGLKQTAKKGINLPEYSPIPLENIITTCPADGIDFINECLRWQPAKRLTATQLLQHPFVKKIGQQFSLQTKQILSSTSNSYQTKKQFSSASTNNNQSSKYIKSSNSINTSAAGLKASTNSNAKKQFSYKSIEHDQLFEELLNNFQNCNLQGKLGQKKTSSGFKPTNENSNGKKIQNSGDDDEWN